MRASLQTARPVRAPLQGAHTLKIWMLTLLSVLTVWTATAAASSTTVSYVVEGDGIPAPLAGLAGDPLRGRQLIINRQQGLCLLCHQGPFPEERFQGDLATNLAGAGRRWSPAQLRLRLVDPGRLQPDSIMPAYHRSDNFIRVAPSWRDRPIFSAQQIEDVVAFLGTLQQPE